jgi:hypothetical protein
MPGRGILSVASVHRARERRGTSLPTHGQVRARPPGMAGGRATPKPTPDSGGSPLLTRAKGPTWGRGAESFLVTRLGTARVQPLASAKTSGAHLIVRSLR